MLEQCNTSCFSKILVWSDFGQHCFLILNYHYGIYGKSFETSEHETIMNVMIIDHPEHVQ